MADILTLNNRPTWMTQARIRLLGWNDTTTLPEETLLAFVEEAELDIKGKATDWASLSSTDLEYLISATICALCAILAPTMPNLIPKTERSADFSEIRDIDWTEVEARLIGESNAYLAKISTYTEPVVVRAAVITPSTSMWEDLEG